MNETGVPTYNREKAVERLSDYLYELESDNEISVDAVGIERNINATFEQIVEEGLRPDTVAARQPRVTLILLLDKGIQYLEPGAFRLLNALETLLLGGNKITEINNDTFIGLDSLKYLNLRHNRINFLEPGCFEHCRSLEYLEILDNRITTIQPGIFSPAVNLKTLDLSENYLTSIEVGMFSDLGSLLFLYLQDNRIEYIYPGAFNGSSQMRILNISENLITHLQADTFTGLYSLIYLDISYNRIMNIDPEAFSGLASLEFLFIVSNTSELDKVHSNSLVGLPSVEKLATSDNRLCCLLEMNANFSCARTARTSPLDTCGSIFPSIALRIAGWVMGLSALVGNAVVLYIRLKKETGGRLAQNELIVSLAVADILMGIFMIIITSADIYYGREYFLIAPEWRGSSVCRFAGFLGFLSSEASVFTLTLITVDRFICIMFPFGKYRIGSKRLVTLIVLIWTMTVALSLFAALITAQTPWIYGLSDVCMGLPLQAASAQTGTLEIRGRTYFEYTVEFVPSDTGTQPMWWFSISIFIVVNLLSFAFIFVCYVAMFVKVSRSGAQVRNDATQKREVKLARRMALIIATDFACWMPVIVMGILSQSGAVTLDTALYAWTVILIVPINSSLNPFLYTLVVYFENKKKAKEKISSIPKTNLTSVDKATSEKANETPV